MNTSDLFDSISSVGSSASGNPVRGQYMKARKEKKQKRQRANPYVDDEAGAKESDEDDVKSTSTKTSKSSRISQPRSEEFTQNQLFSGIDSKEKPVAPPPVRVMDAWLDAQEFDEIKQEPIEDYEWCFACRYSNLIQEADRNPDYGRLLELMRESQGMMDDETLCEQSQSFYNKYLRGCIKEEPKPWSKRCVWAHIYKHRPTLEVDTYKDIKRYNSIIDTLYATGIFVPTDSGMTVNQSNIKLFISLNQERNRLQKQMATNGTLKKTM
jgi:hypothetical protein